MSPEPEILTTPELAEPTASLPELVTPSNLLKVDVPALFALVPLSFITGLLLPSGVAKLTSLPVNCNPSLVTPVISFIFPPL